MTVLTSYLPLCVYSEDSCEDMMSSGEESLSSSLGSDAEGSFFPPHLRRQNQRQYLYAWSLCRPCLAVSTPHHPVFSCRFFNLLFNKLWCWWRIAQLAAERLDILQVDLIDLVCRCVSACWDVTFQDASFFFSFFFCKDISDVLQINSGQPGLQGAELADTWRSLKCQIGLEE